MTLLTYSQPPPRPTAHFRAHTSIPTFYTYFTPIFDFLHAFSTFITHFHAFTTPGNVLRAPEHIPERTPLVFEDFRPFLLIFNLLRLTTHFRPFALFFQVVPRVLDTFTSTVNCSQVPERIFEPPHLFSRPTDHSQLIFKHFRLF